jgi:DNA-binding transcriptional MerR regulator
MTVSMLAGRCGLSRSTLLYYESLGLLRRPPRTDGNYRAYGDADLLRLQQIGLYRKVGLSLAAIRTVLDEPGGDAASVLQRRLTDIDTEIENLRGHQRAILRLLKRSRTLRRTEMMTKDKWVAIMRGAGFTESDMSRWHAEFEKSAPAEHEEFLQFLHIQPAEIKTIRASSRKAAARS